MSWDVVIHPAFREEIDRYDRAVRVALLARANLLSDYGPNLGRPYVDSLKGSKTANM